MKGYKALSSDMRAIYGNGMQYELGKTFSVKGEIVPCQNGFHFCDKIENLNIYYDILDSRIFEIEAEGDIIQDGMKYVARKIKLVREIIRQEIDDYFRENYENLIKSNEAEIRKVIAEQGYGLDVLIHDNDCDVRTAVAEQGYGLDKLICDESCFVRRVVAERGYGLDVLVHDENSKVRCAVARQGYGLDILVHDEDCCVRCAVARQGYGLDKLIYDKEWFVREAARKMLDNE